MKEWIPKIFDKYTQPQKMIFRVDAGRVWGLSFGHLSRCLILAGFIQNLYKSEVLFVMRDYTDGVACARKSGQKVKRFTPELNFQEEISLLDELIEHYRPDWLLIDLPYPEVEASYFEHLKREDCRIIFIDDNRFINANVDVILNSSILALKKTTVPCNCKTQYFLGPHYFIFDDSKIHSEPVRKDGMINVVLTFGGSDPADITLKALETITSEPWPGVYFNTILGPGYIKLDKIDGLLQTKKNNFQLVFNPENYFSYLMGCDLAVCAGGRTMYELLYLNKKLLPIASAEHESEVISEGIRQGLFDLGMPFWEASTFLTYLKKIIFQLQGR